MQFEKAYAEFLHPGVYPKVATALQIIPGLGDGAYRRECFSMVKLNGTASTVRTPEQGLAREYKTYLSSDFKTALHQVGSYYDDDIPYVNFAWEDDGWRNRALERIDHVETLVVIGYSFPLVNRDIDHEVLTRLLCPEKLYVQAGKDGPAVKERLAGLGVDAEKVSLIEDVDQFHVPDGYSPSERMLPDHFNEPLG